MSWGVGGVRVGVGFGLGLGWVRVGDRRWTSARTGGRHPHGPSSACAGWALWLRASLLRGCECRWNPGACAGGRGERGPDGRLPGFSALCRLRSRVCTFAFVVRLDAACAPAASQPPSAALPPLSAAVLFIVGPLSPPCPAAFPSLCYNLSPFFPSVESRDGRLFGPDRTLTVVTCAVATKPALISKAQSDDKHFLFAFWFLLSSCSSVLHPCPLDAAPSLLFQM